MTMTNTARLISAVRKRRGVAKASITRLTKGLKDLEAKTDEPKILSLAQHATKRLEMSDQLQDSGSTGKRRGPSQGTRGPRPSQQ